MNPLQSRNTGPGGENFRCRSGVENDEVFTKKEAAEYFKVHVNTIDAWRKQGMPCVQRTPGGNVRFSKNEIAEWYFSKGGQNNE